MGIQSPEVPRLRDLITEGPVCAECLAFRTGMRLAHVWEALQQIGAVAPLTTELGRCDRCLREKVVHASR